MKRQLSFQEYRNLDLFFFAVILLFSEALIVRAAGTWFRDQLYTVSVSAAVTAIVLVRWGPWAAIHAALGGAIFTWAAGGSLRQLLVYALGNELSMAALLLIRAFGKEKIRTNKLLTLLFALCVQLLMQLGRALMALLFGGRIADTIDFFTTDSLSNLFSMVVVWIAARLDGVLEDQKTYLLRVHRQMEKERGGSL